MGMQIIELAQLVQPMHTSHVGYDRSPYVISVLYRMVVMKMNWNIKSFENENKKEK